MLNKRFLFFLFSIFSLFNNIYSYGGEITFYIHGSGTTIYAQQVEWICWAPRNLGNYITEDYKFESKFISGGNNGDFDVEHDDNGIVYIGRSIYRFTTTGNYDGPYFYVNTFGEKFIDIHISYSSDTKKFSWGPSGTSQIIETGTLILIVQSVDHSVLRDGWAFMDDILYLLQESNPIDHDGENPKIFWAPHNDFNPSHYEIFRAITQNPPNDNDYQLIATVSSDVISYTDYAVQIFDTEAIIYYRVRAKKETYKRSYYSDYSNNVFTIGGLYKDRSKPSLDLKNETLTLSNYPNPFNPTTKIVYTIPNNGLVSLVVYNLLGEEIDVLIDKFQLKGTYSIEFNGEKYSSGLYVYRISTENFTKVNTMILTK